MSTESANWECFLYRIVLAPASQSSCDWRFIVILLFLYGVFGNFYFMVILRLILLKRKTPNSLTTLYSKIGSGITQNYFS